MNDIADDPIPVPIDRAKAAEVWHRIEELGYEFPPSDQRFLCFQAAKEFARTHDLEGSNL